MNKKIYYLIITMFILSLLPVFPTNITINNFDTPFIEGDIPTSPETLQVYFRARSFQNGHESAIYIGQPSARIVRFVGNESALFYCDDIKRNMTGDSQAWCIHDTIEVNTKDGYREKRPVAYFSWESKRLYVNFWQFWAYDLRLEYDEGFDMVAVDGGSIIYSEGV